MRGESDEYQRLLDAGSHPKLPPPPVPGRAKKAILIAILLCLLGLVCFSLFVVTFFPAVLRLNQHSRWPLFIFGLLALPSGVYTLYLAYLIYHRKPGYHWPMIFL
jgi:hypothetical protein